MNHRRLRFLLMFLISSVAPCLAHHMAVVVDKQNKMGNISSPHLAKIFRAEGMSFWYSIPLRVAKRRPCNGC
jgi:hypothetical protein